MYKYKPKKRTQLRVNESVEGELIETKIERITTQKEPISDGAQLIYNERKDGVLAGQNIKTDRFDLAIEAMDKASKMRVAKRDELMKKDEVIADESTDDTK